MGIAVVSETEITNNGWLAVSFVGLKLEGFVVLGPWPKDRLEWIVRWVPS